MTIPSASGRSGSALPGPSRAEFLRDPSLYERFLRKTSFRSLCRGQDRLQSQRRSWKSSKKVANQRSGMASKRQLPWPTRFSGLS